MTQWKFVIREFFKLKSSLRFCLKFLSTMFLSVTSSCCCGLAYGFLATLTCGFCLLSSSGFGVLIIGISSTIEHLLQTFTMPLAEIASNKIAFSSDMPHLKHSAMKKHNGRLFNILYY